MNLLDVYLFTGGFGFIWVVGTALLGVTGADDAGSAGDGGDGGDGGDMGSADGGDAGDAGGDLGGADAGGDAGGDLGNLQTNAVNTFRAGLMFRKKKFSPVMLILKLISPSTITTFMAFFGISGYLVLHVFPWLGLISLLPATVFGVMGYNATSAISGLIYKKMHVTTSYNEEHFIGTEAEITVPIDSGRMGEVTYLAKGIRQTAPAKAVDPTASFPTGSRVMLSDRRDGVFFVETWGLDESWPTVEPIKKVEKH
jgi:hypothetical protein